MLCFRFNPGSFLLLLPLSLAVFSSLVSGSHGYPSRVIVEEGKYGRVATWSTRRSVAETGSNSSLTLAQERTYRRDPYDDFKPYTGGWNISNDHYWASVGFTAAPLFIIAGIWLLVFGLCLCLGCLCFCCCRREPYGYSRIAYALALIFLILFTIAAIIGCVVLYTGQGKFHAETTDTLKYVLSQADDTIGKLQNVSGVLSTAKGVVVDTFPLPQDVQTKIDDIDKKINSSIATLGKVTYSNKKDIQNVFDSVRLALIIVAAVMLLLAFLGFLASIFGLQCLVYSFVIIGWILVAGTFILCGVFLLLHNVVGDTCVAMDEWVKSPASHTALDDILPCVDNNTAREILTQTKSVTYQLVNIVDGVIANVSNGNFPPELKPLYFNQSGPLMPLLCNPFNSDLTDRKCASGEIRFDNASEVWKKYVCQVSSGICSTRGRVTPNIYTQMTAAANVSYGLYHYGPFLVDLVDCTFVRQTFTDIHSRYCPGLWKYSRWIYIGLVMVSAAVMLSLIFWVIYARERRHRKYTKQFIAGSGEGYYGPYKRR